MVSEGVEHGVNAQPAWRKVERVLEKQSEEIEGEIRFAENYLAADELELEVSGIPSQRVTRRFHGPPPVGESLFFPAKVGERGTHI